MFELNGKYNSCNVFTECVDNETISQLYLLLNQPFVENSTIRIMPDTHAGKGCVIGTTMTIDGAVCPNLVGVDIGCGVRVVKLDNKNIDLNQLDDIIHNEIPSGANINDNVDYAVDFDITNLDCFNKAHINETRAYASIGTLGGGNHFIELDVDENNNFYLVIHTGSRHLGLEIANFYQDKAYEALCDEMNGGSREELRTNLITRLKSQDRQREIESELAAFDAEYKSQKLYPQKDLAYVKDELLASYLHDMKICQQYAAKNRHEISYRIIENMRLNVVDEFETVHNYIDTDNMILRKGAVSAQKGEKLIIPMNMRDGSLICTGKGNPEWNFSAPHGAGRIMSRAKAKEQISIQEFEQTMRDIYSTSVSISTIDESPMAYKPMQSIIDVIGDTVDIIERITPVYNFKAS